MENSHIHDNTFNKILLKKESQGVLFNKLIHFLRLRIILKKHWNTLNSFIEIKQAVMLVW